MTRREFAGGATAFAATMGVRPLFADGDSPELVAAIDILEGLKV